MGAGGYGGTKRWPVTCPYCGGVYILTNFMIRGQLDTHIIGCQKRTPQQRAAWWKRHRGGGDISPEALAHLEQEQLEPVERNE